MFTDLGRALKSLVVEGGVSARDLSRSCESDGGSLETRQLGVLDGEYQWQSSTVR